MLTPDVRLTLLLQATLANLMTLARLKAYLQTMHDGSQLQPATLLP